MSIIEHDFGRELRQVVRRFTKLLGLDALHEANVRTNPVPYLERASEHIDRLEAALVDAARATTRPADEPPSTEVISVNKADYQRLLICRALVGQAVAQLASDSDAS